MWTGRRSDATGWIGADHVRRFMVVAVAGICVLTAACGGNSDKSPFAKGGNGSSASSAPPPPLAASALDGLLLSSDQIDTAMGATGMGVAWSNNNGELPDDTETVSDKNCLANYYPGELPVYAGSGWITARNQQLHQPGSDFTAFVQQAVVLFPAATDAAAFFTTSTKQWQTCANRRYTYTRSGESPAIWTVSAVSNTSGTLNARRTQEGFNGWNCQRALTVRNNVSVDVSACSYTEGDFGIKIAHQIANKVLKQ